MKHLLFAVALLALTACNRPPAVEREFGEKVRAYLLENPEVLQEAYAKLQEKEDAKKLAASGEALKKHRAALERDSRDFVANPQGKVTVVEFFDYNCGYCKVIAPDVMALVREHPDVRFVFKDMTIFGETSEFAAAAAHEARKSGKYLALHGEFMATKPLDDAGVEHILTRHGGDPEAARATQQSAAQKDYLSDVHDLASELGIQGTPAFIVGDTMIPGADAAALRAAIEKAKKG
jgi:protein-disulfide isomerase